MTCRFVRDTTVINDHISAVWLSCTYVRKIVNEIKIACVKKTPLNLYLQNGVHFIHIPVY